LAPKITSSPKLLLTLCWGNQPTTTPLHATKFRDQVIKYTEARVFTTAKYNVAILYFDESVAIPITNIFERIPEEFYGQYRQFYLQADIRQTRIGILLLAIPNLSYIINDYQFLGLSMSFAGFILLRLAILAATIWLFFYLGKIKDYRSYDKSILIYALALAIAVLSNFTRPQNAIAQAVAISVGVLITYLIVNTKFAYQIVIASTVTAVQLSIILLNTNMFAPQELFTASLSMLFANLIAAVASWQLHTYRWRHFQDLNERKRTERLTIIGETAGMVGHDLRNPLQSTIGEIYLANEELKKLAGSEQKTNLQESINAIEEQALYMDKIVSDLQTFVKTIEVHKKTLKLKQQVMSVLSQVDIPNNIQTNVSIDDQFTVNADQQLLKRVIINLVTNATQAMPKGGKLTIEAKTIERGNVQVIVEDTGVGIPIDIKEKVFQPLFTTKSRGQGFGLAVCKRVIEAHGGDIVFESQEGKGTKFIITLPP
jgi:signal transduction histidine kinase